MMGWWSSSASSALDEQVNKATSSSLEDIALNLEISDVIRSKTVPPKEAMRSLKKRIGDKNPNTQLSALNLTDTCVKNGGQHFLAEIASKEFMDNLVSLLKAIGPASVNHDVRTKILELIQHWAAATEGRYELNYIGEVYRTLQREGFQFPPRVSVSSSMIDSSAPPEWVDSDVCMRCRTAFTFTNRKHHCRNCGNVFDQQCSTKTLPLPHLGILQPVRVDDGCYAKLTDKSGGRGGGYGPEPSPSKSSFNKRQSLSMQPRNARVDDGFDEDLKKALAMSLEEVQSHQNGRDYVAPANNTRHSHPKVNGDSTSKAAEEEDADLKAAIAASLADMEEQKKQHAAALKEQTSSAGNAAPSTFALPKNDYELTPVEAENINLFSTLVDRLQTQPPGTILREPQIQELYDSIGTLRPKLARTYGETMSKHDTLLDLHAKLQTAVRYYDRMLEERLSKAFHNQNLGGYNLPPPRQSSGPYPNIQANVPTNHAGPAESFYTGESQQDYGRPAAQPSYPYPTQPTPQPQYATYDQRASLPGPSQHQYPQQQQQPRQDSWRASAPPGQYPPQANYPPSESATPQMSHLALPQQQPNAPESVGTTPISDPSASFYFQQPGQNPLGSPSAPPEAAPSPYPNLQQTMQQYPQQAQNGPETPTPTAHAQPAQQQQPPQQQVPPPQQHQQQPQAPYWQHPAAQHVQMPVSSSAPWQQPPQQQQQPQYSGYHQEAFPSAPQHAIAPPKPAVEEALIEL
ncbi:hypothetical protein N8I77_011581 [Diaporthe amygdali]|uniref:Vacuolar protein sorting-associated protein 27 n=1 Tax=Phomopsis amygdali TaxID=1214568 RepID=A0AAD9S5Q3_PHOAM|nr:hypothetical protein N8I77_011581 [Diaporthe amygdali]